LFPPAGARLFVITGEAATAFFLPPGYFFNRPCGNQMDAKLWEVVCDEHGIGGSGVYCGDNDAHLGCINVLYH
jgi:hypothetical protein